MGIEFLITSLIVVVVPGTGVIYTVSVALSGGRRRGLIAAVGCTLGIVPHLLAAVFGLSGFMYAGALAFRVLKYAGVAYLLFLAVTMARAKTAAFDNHGESPAGAARVIVRGILLNLLNPKLTLRLPPAVPLRRRRHRLAALAWRGVHGPHPRRVRGVRRRSRRGAGRLPGEGRPAPVAAALDGGPAGRLRHQAGLHRAVGRRRGYSSGSGKM